VRQVADRLQQLGRALARKMRDSLATSLALVGKWWTWAPRETPARSTIRVVVVFA